ncbi:hypothetical protein HETIRDRAFT_174197 [Heterobasidion irregulare TC 32-1]|uniref:Uncharacterized protein n=1 Tax=Heterobasidion irregulare (strain TC 32-1) TaxID=747525 RepID=W4JVQ3_HETIT|nr:uncharacterized protein HETIRDRAFT_174197 [Heterobasidion irregulare TC 32-1]ETW77160.1 hypothetical protein HETIRDRAFT_174197 [Heterobasidion irregulare TC 32-1]
MPLFWIALEFSNPRVGPHIQVYPEDSGTWLSEAWQGMHWREEIDPVLTTPMVCLAGQDFFIYKPAKLQNGDICMPMHWFFCEEMCDGNKVPHYYANAWRLQPVVSEDGLGGYVAHKYDSFVVDAVLFTLSLPQLIATFQVDNLPDPCMLLAKGHWVLSLMMWLYCDDTSGNLSKKWNKHNSFLWTPAGLPREQAQRQYNVHFLSTSNIAPPLEMLDGIVTQHEDGQHNGVWAWDIASQEMVLVLPVVLALLGDNPMQSEMACHIGLRGKFFCRTCWVKGRDADNEVASLAAGTMAREEAEASDAPSTLGGSSIDGHSHVGHSSLSSAEGVIGVHQIGPVHCALLSFLPTTPLMSASLLAPLSITLGNDSETVENNSHKSAPRTKKGRPLETLQQLTDRTRRFLGPLRLRNAADTRSKLKTIFDTARTVGGMTELARLHTMFGVKDTYQETFMDRIFALGRKFRGSLADKQRKMDDLMASFPADVTSPVWRIKGLDPHLDTPVEILHVILLGFVKYFWQDAIARQDAKGKALLITRLSSLDVMGLGCSALAGQTLVQYAGSLTGHDFRVVAQAAPFVLYDLIDEDCYKAWLALSQLIPMVWQPCIENVDQHLTELEQCIDYFLDCTVRWTPWWFNKPKFHIVCHLPYHIRCFGPAILFATEAFESFNAVIREQSIHSNRHAPLIR